MPIISVIVPIYNREKYLKRCIDSILAQSFTDFELILVDDGSTDNSLNICKEYAENDNRIVVVHQENGGVSRARNHGLERAMGKYITFCDSDDYVDENWLSCMYEGYSDKNVKLSICGLKYLDESGNFRNDTNNIKDEFFKISDFHILFKKISLGSVWNKLFISEIIKHNRLSFEEGISYGEDYIFALNYLQFISGFDKIFLSKEMPYVYRYYQGEESLSKSYNPKLYEMKVRVVKQLESVFYSFGIKDEDYQPLIYEQYLYTINAPIYNVLLTDKLNWFNKILKLRTIVRDDYFKKMIPYVNLTSIFSKRFSSILKTRNALLIYLYFCLSRIKK